MGASSSKIIVLVGPYGSGKSQFIDCLTQRTRWANHSLSPQDKSVRSTKAKMRDRGTVVLVDTPGFDDFTRSAEDILEDVYDWLRRNYKKDAKVTGILYLQNIGDNRLTIPPPRRILTDLFGDAAARHLIFVTTHWDQVGNSRGGERERQYRQRLETFLRAGVHMERFDMRQERAWEIIESLVSSS